MKVFSLEGKKGKSMSNGLNCYFNKSKLEKFRLPMQSYFLRLLDRDNAMIRLLPLRNLQMIPRNFQLKRIPKEFRR